MSLNISEEKMAEYRAGYQQRQAAAKKVLQERFQLAWQIAREGAALLKDEFGAERVLVFGSLTNETRFHSRSDVDLVAWGMDGELYLKAVGRLLDLNPAIPVDLILFEESSEYLKKSVLAEGIDL